LAPVADALSDDEKAMLKALWTDEPSWMTATLSAIEALGSNRVSNAWVTAALSEEVSVVGVDGRDVVGVDGRDVVGAGPTIVGGGTVSVVALVAITGEMGVPAGALEAIPLGALSFR